MKKLWFGLTVLVLVGFATLSCNIGLGAAVDTQPPEVKVERPEVGAVIRSSFAIAGSYSDDGVIKSPDNGGLTVELERTDGTGSKYSYTGSFDKDAGTWTCSIDPFAEGKTLVDGEYQATITMVDTYEHKTIKTTTFTVDNTAPIIVLQRPSAKKGSSSADSYGQSFTLEGQAADDNNVNQVVISIYSDEDCTEKVHTVTLNNVPPTIELDVAQFVDGKENDYSKIYGSTSKENAQTKSFYCQIVAYDGAQKYPVDGSEQSSSDKLGNSTNHYYLYEEISASILNDYKITEVYHMNNGTYTGGDDSSRSATISSVKSILAENKITTGYFSLNPANNPTFVVSGRNTLSKDGTDFDDAHVANWEISNGTKVQVEVSTGLDGIPLEADTLGVYVIECDAYGNPKSDAEKIQIIKPKTELSDDAAIENRASLMAKSGTSYKFTTLLDVQKTPKLQFKKSYIFGVNGYDQKGNAVSDFGKSYGFYFLPSGAAPVITLTTPKNNVTYLHKGQTQVFEGTAEVEDSVPVISLMMGDDTIASTNLSESDATKLDSGKLRYSFRFEVPASGKNSFNQKTSTQYNFTVLATKDGNTSTAAKTIMYDVDAPQVSLISISPKAAHYPDESGNTDGKEYLNGKIQMKISVTDEFDTVDTSKENKYEFIQNGEVKISGKLDKFPTQEIKNIDTTKLVDNQEVEIVITAYDRAGNELKTSSKHSVKNGDVTVSEAHLDSFGTSLVFNVNQDTDKPYIIPGTKTTFLKNTTESLDTNTSANPNGYNIFASSQQIIVKCIDDDGIKLIEPFKGTSAGDLTPHQSKNKEFTVYPTEESFSYYLPDAAGIYYLQFKVTDKNDVVRETPVFIVKITAAYPVISKLESDRKYSNGVAPNTFKNTITINSDQTPFSVYRNTTGTFDLEHDTPIYTGLTDTTFTDDGYKADGTGTTGTGLLPAVTTKYYYCVRDVNLHESNVSSIECKVEKDAPETLTITSPASGKTGTSAVSDKNYTFGGKVKDNVSGVTKIHYYFVQSDTTPANPADSAYTTVDASNGSWSVDATINSGKTAAATGNLYEGKWYLFVKAEDEAGNITATPVKREFDIDLYVPTLTLDSLAKTTINSALTLSGTASDTFELKSIKITDNKNASFAKDVTLPSAGTTDWTTTISLGSGTDKLADGDHELVVTATDKVGKTTTEKVSVLVDTKNPVVDSTITVPKGAEFDNATVEFRGKASDTAKSGANKASGIENVKIWFTNADETKSTTPVPASGTTNWTYTLTPSGEVFTDQGTKKVYVQATDAAGNLSDPVSATFVYDTANPEITAIKYKVGATETDIAHGGKAVIKTQTFSLLGSYSDTGTATNVEVTRGGTPVTVTGNGSKSGNWSVAESLATDGTYSYNILAKDASGRTSATKTVSILLDRTAPETLTITAPAEGKINKSAISDTNYTFGGRATDALAGVAKIHYCFIQSDTAPANPADSAYTKVDASNGSWSVEKIINSGKTAAATGNLYEGKWYLFVKAEDEAGNITATPVKREFDIDLSAPTLTVASLAKTTINTTLALSGTASDTYELKSIKITDNKNASFAKTVTLPSAGTTDWSTTISLGSGTDKLADGDHELVVTATDKVGKTTTEKVSVLVDTKKPEVGTSITVPKGSEFDNATVEFRGTAKDEKATGANKASGVSKVTVYFTNGTDAEASGYKKSESYPAEGTTNWTYTLTPSGDVFATQGTKYIYVQAVDEAGNKSTVVNKPFVYDTADPEITAIKYKVGATETEIAHNQSAILATKTFSLLGTYADTGTATNVEVTRSGTPVTVSGNGSLSGNWSVAESLTADGTYSYNILAKDASGRTSTTHTISLQVDTTPPTVATVECPSEYDTERTSITFSGTANDGSGSGIKEVYFGFAAKTTDADLADTSKFIKAKGTDNWYYTLNTTTEFTSLWTTSGSKTVYVYAVDKAGNISTVNSQAFNYDTRSPTLDVLKYQPVSGGSAITVDADNAGKYSFFLGGLFTLDLTTSDDWGVASVKYTEKKGNGTASAPAALTSTTKLPVQGTSNGKPTTDTYDYVITITDNAGKTTTKNLTVQIDVTRPTITITSPALNAAGTETVAKGDGSLSGDDYSFQGNVSDEGYAGLKAYYYAITTDATAPATSGLATAKDEAGAAYTAGEWRKVATTTNGLWTLKKNLITNTGTNTKDNIYEGHYYLHVIAEDNAGNISASAVTREFYVDKAAPIIGSVAYKDGANSKVSLPVGKTYYKSTNGTVTFSGTVSDSYGVASITLNGAALTPSSGKWSKSVSVTADADVTVRLVATDTAGRKTTQEYILHRDTKNPSVEITNPDTDVSGANSLSGSTYTFRGAVSDSGSGVATYKYILTDTEITGADADAVRANIISSAEAGTGWTTKTSGDGFSETMNLVEGRLAQGAVAAADSIYEGQHYLYLYAIDGVGNKYAVGRSYWVDKKNPELRETSVGATGRQLKKGESVTLSGTVSDANGITNLVISDDLSDNTWSVTPAADGSWTKTIAAGSGTDKLCDGEHSLTIRATDGASKESQLTRTVTVDTILPSATQVEFKDTPDYTDSNSYKWFKNQTVNIKVSGATDTQSTATAKAPAYCSDVAAVEYTTDDGSTWISMTQGTGSDAGYWVASVYCSVQGKNSIKTRVRDALGNVSATKAAMNIDAYIDTAAPLTPKSAPAQGTNDAEWWVELRTLTAAEKTAEATTAPTATAAAVRGYKDQLLVNADTNKRVFIEVIATDANSTTANKSSGIRQVAVNAKSGTKVVSTTTTNHSASVYNFVLPLSEIEDGACTVTITDNVGNTKEFSPFSYKVDTTKPKVSLGTVNDADTSSAGKTDINGSIKIEVTATDNYELDTVTLKYKVGGETAPTWSGVNNTLTIDKTTTPWTATINTTALTGYADNSNLYLQLTATDKAGNTQAAAATKTLFINQNSDRPVIKLTNLVKDSAGNYILKYGDNATLEGIVTDDDGTSTAVIKEFIASGVAITPDTLASKTGTTTIDKTTGDFKFAPASAGDGSKDVYFYIKDNNDKEFYTTATAELSRAYYQFKTDSKADNNAKVTYKSDGNAPTLNSVQLQAWKNASGTAETDKNGTASALGSGCVAGGTTKRYVDLKVSAKDANGITGVTVELSNGTVNKYYRSNDKVSISGVTTYTSTGSIAATTSESSNHEYTIPRVDLNDFTGITAGNTGSVTVKVYAYDGAGLYSNQDTLFVVDRQAGTISITEPSTDITTDTNAIYAQQNLKVSGTPTGTDVSKIYFTVTKDTTQPTTGWTELSGQTMSAVVVFDKDTDDSTPKTSTSGQHTVILREWLKKVYTQTITSNGTTTYKKWNGTAWVDTTETPEEVIYADDNIKDLYVWFKVEDNCGNTDYSKRRLKVIPNGDKPTVTLSYPVNKLVGQTSTVPALAGTIRVNGTAYAETADPQGIYIQIDTNYNGSTFNESWKSAFDTLVSGKETGYVIENFGTNTSPKYGIKANGTQNWNLPINTANEFLPTGGATQRNMAIRIYGRGPSGKLSEPVIQLLNIDPNAPKIGGDGTNGRNPIELVQLSNTTTPTISNRMTYDSTKDIWLKGQWYIYTSIYDDNGISSIKLDEGLGRDKIDIVKLSGSTPTKQTASTYYGTNIIVKDNACGYTGKANYDVYIPLPTVSGTATYTIEATEHTDNLNSTAVTLKVNYDDVAPRIGTKAHGDVSIPEAVAQDNGFYRIKGYATDATDGSKVSDIMAIAFYFVRRGSQNTRVYDPMWYNKSVAVQTGTTNTSGITYEYGMFWKSATVTRSSARTLTLPAADDNIHAGGFVQLGGKIYTIQSVSGTTVTLKTDVPTSLTAAKFAYALVIDNFNSTESIDGRTKETDKSKYGYGYYKAGNASADDGDLMQEKYNNGVWEAYINSANIPDGPIEIHYVALDNAQNFSVGIIGNLSVKDYEEKSTLDVAANKALNTDSTALTSGTNNLVRGYYYSYDANNKAYISNNAPRIAGVKVGCDYDGSGTISADEKTELFYNEGNYLFSGALRQKPKSVTNKFIASGDKTKDGSVAKVIKGDASVELEIVGGNSDLYLRYSLDGATYKEHSAITTWVNYLTAADKTANKTASVILAGTTTRATEYKEDDDNKVGYYIPTVLPALNFSEKDIKDAITSNSNKYWFTFEVHDSTEETTLWSSSQYCELKLPLSIQVHDQVKPNTVFNDLYWNSAADNSIYKDVNGKLYGHIELHSELNATSNTEMNTYYGVDDDKVSGVIKFSGYAYDNKRLSSLNYGITTTKNSIGQTVSGTTVTRRANNTNQAWPQTMGQPYVTFNGSTWTTSGISDTDLADNKIGTTQPWSQFKVYTDAEHGAYIGADGHKVYWELIIDTSRVQAAGQTADNPLGVGRDLYFWVEAVDTTGNGTNMNTTDVTSGTDAQKLRPYYKVDVVPYITGVTTRLAGKNTPDPTVYSRTAKGHYPIASNEGNITLSGYNLSGANADVTVASSTITASSAYAYTRVAANGNTRAIVSINNMNNNNAHGAYNINQDRLAESTKVANMYNRTPNTSTNLTLTDDVYFDVWEIKKAAAPTTGKIKEPVMRINPQNDQIAFAFANGADKLTLPNAVKSDNTYTSTSASVWQSNYADYGQINFVFDNNGYAHSISVGKDTEPSSGLAGRMQYINSSWGYTGSNLWNWNLSRTVALESVGIPKGVYVGDTALGSNLIDVDRFGKPTIAVSKTTTTRTNPTVYVAYYDGDNAQIRFRYGTVNEFNTTRTKQFGLLSDEKAHNSGTISTDTTNGGSTYARHGMFEAHHDYYEVLAGKTQKTDANTAQTDTGNGATEYVALDVVSGTSETADVVVIVWYDGSNLMYTYRSGDKFRTDASSNGVTSTTGEGDAKKTAVWSKPVTIFSGAGQYCAIKVDQSNGIHIAAYDRTNANLRYCYMSSYSDAVNKKTCIVDAYSQVGEYISIDTALLATGGKVVPYITYYADGLSGLPKVASLPTGINSSTTLTDGASGTTNLFSGDWEVSLVPTGSEVNKDNMNIGIWKTSGGVIKSSTNPASGYTEPSITGTRSTDVTWYGNGSSKYVLGYGITDVATGYIETAQLKN